MYLAAIGCWYSSCLPLWWSTSLASTVQSAISAIPCVVKSKTVTDNVNSSVNIPSSTVECLYVLYIEIWRQINEVWLVKLSYPPGLAQSGRLCRQCRIVSGRLLRAPPRFHVALSLGIHHLVHLHLALVAGHHGVDLLVVWYVAILFLAVLPVCYLLPCWTFRALQ